MYTTTSSFSITLWYLLYSTLLTVSSSESCLLEFELCYNVLVFITEDIATGLTVGVFVENRAET